MFDTVMLYFDDILSEFRDDFHEMDLRIVCQMLRVFLFVKPNLFCSIQFIDAFDSSIKNEIVSLYWEAADRKVETLLRRDRADLENRPLVDPERSATNPRPLLSSWRENYFNPQRTIPRR